MLKIKRDIIRQFISKYLTSVLSKLKIFHPLDVVDRASETQLQMGGNSYKNNLAVKGLKWQTRLINPQLIIRG